MMRVSLHSLFKSGACAGFCTQTSVRILTPAKRDIPALAALAKKTYEESYHGSIFTPELFDFKFGDNYINNILPAELKNPNIHYLVCKHANKLIGYAKMDFTDGGAYLDKLYLLKTYQGQGLGKLLLLRCFEETEKRGKTSMTLSAFEFNQRAIQFYESFGFHQQGEHHRHVHVMTGEETQEYYIDMKCDNLSAQLLGDNTSAIKHQ